MDSWHKEKGQAFSFVTRELSMRLVKKKAATMFNCLILKGYQEQTDSRHSEIVQLDLIRRCSNGAVVSTIICFRICYCSRSPFMLQEQGLAPSRCVANLTAKQKQLSRRHSKGGIQFRKTIDFDHESKRNRKAKMPT